MADGVLSRDFRALGRGWAWTLAAELLVAAFRWWLLPLTDELLQPLVFVALLPGLWGTWRWLRPRRTKDRRTGDRRHAPRRTDEGSD